MAAPLFLFFGFCPFLACTVVNERLNPGDIGGELPEPHRQANKVGQLRHRRRQADCEGRKGVVILVGGHAGQCKGRNEGRASDPTKRWRGNH